MKHGVLFAGIIGFMFFGGCGSNQALLKVSELEKNQSVHLTLKNGQKLSGEIYQVDSQSVTVVDKNNKAWRAQKRDINDARGPLPVYDMDGRIVSERKIAQGIVMCRSQFFCQ